MAKQKILEFLKHKYALEECINVNDEYGMRFHTLLHTAAEKGWVEVIALLLASGANINAKDIFGATPIYLAACNGHTSAVAYLASKGADVNSLHSRENIPMQIAAENGYTEVVKILMRYGAYIERKNSFGATPLITAATYGKLETLQVLLKAGARVDGRFIDSRAGSDGIYKNQLQITKMVMAECSRRYSNPLFADEVRVFYTSLLHKTVEALTYKSYKPNTIIRNYQEIPNFINRSELIDVIKLLFQNGVSPLLKDKQGFTLFWLFKKYYPNFQADLLIVDTKRYNSSMKDVLYLIINEYILSNKGKYARYAQYNFANLSIKSCFALNPADLLIAIGYIKDKRLLCSIVDIIRNSNLEPIYINVEYCIQLVLNTTDYFLTDLQGMLRC